MAAKPTAVFDERTVGKICAVFENFSQCRGFSEALLNDRKIVSKLGKQGHGVASVVVGILKYWVKQNGDRATGEALQAALENSLGSAADQFRTDLIGIRKWTHDLFCEKAVMRDMFL